MGNESRAARDHLAGEAAEGVVVEDQTKADRARAGRARASRHAIVAAGGRYALVVGGTRVEFGDDASVATLRRVLEALR